MGFVDINIDRSEKKLDMTKEQFRRFAVGKWDAAAIEMFLKLAHVNGKLTKVRDYVGVGDAMVRVTDW